MKVEAVNPETGKKVAAELSSEQEALLRGLDGGVSDSGLDAYIERLKLSPQYQAVVSRLKKLSVAGGGKTFQVGKRIVEIAVALQAQFPYATFGVMLGLVISLVVTAIPVLGTLIAGVVTPVAVGLGFAIGITADIQDKALYKKISSATARFNPYRPSITEAKQALEQLFRTLVPQT